MDVVAIIEKLGAPVAFAVFLFFLSWRYLANQGKDSEVDEAQAQAGIAQAKALIEAIRISGVQSENLIKQTEVLGTLVTRLETHDDRVNNLQKNFDTAINRMTSTVGERDKEFEKLPERIQNAMSDKMPLILEPLFEALKREILDLKNEISPKICSPDQAKQLIDSSLESALDRFYKRMEEKLNEIIKIDTQLVDLRSLNKEKENETNLEKS